MKTQRIVLIACILLMNLIVRADGGKYEEIMGNSIPQIYSAGTLEELDALTNKFSRIGDAENDKWLPYYYASLSQVFKAFKIEDNAAKDATLDEGLKYVAKGKELAASNSELEALEGFINMIKIGIDPGTRGQTLSPGIYASFGKSMSLDPNNPRAVLFMGQMQMGTAEFFKQSLDESCQLIIRADQMFKNPTVTDPLLPNWGQYGIEDWMSKCNN
ncbi:MAG: hypothetical protein OCD76_24740 [Reichenbachiella sp.]